MNYTQITRLSQGFNLSHTASRLAAMVRPVYQAVCRHGGKLRPRPALVFVPSRRETKSTAVDMLAMQHAGECGGRGDL